MSATLGPVHYRMYGRILLQDQLVLGILHLAEQEGWNLNLPPDLPPPLIVDDLAKIIDPTNIHGWLNTQVTAVERRLASLLISALETDFEQRMTKLQDLFYQTGIQYKIELKAPEYTAKTIYELVHYYLLDGMPCDFPFQVVTEGDDRIYRWQVVKCPHKAYYTSQSRILACFYRLRTYFVRGLLLDIPASYTWDGDIQFAITKEERE